MSKIAIGTADGTSLPQTTDIERVFDNEEQAKKYLDWVQAVEPSLHNDGVLYWATIGKDNWYHPMSEAGMKALKETVGAKAEDVEYEVLADGRVFDHVEGYVLAVCECDNTHRHNDTVCRWCWAHGRRKWNDPDVGGK